MKRTFSFGVLLLCLVVSLSAAYGQTYGQGYCSIGTIVGTYAFNFTGSSTIINGPSADGFNWNALYAPIAGAGVFTVQMSWPHLGGTADGYYWMIAGAMDLGHDPLESIPFHATISVNRDCTGVMDYSFGPYAMSEQMLILNNGDEIRSLAVKTAVPTSTWITTARRVGGACTQNTIAGLSYLISCKSINPLDPANIFAGASLIRVNYSSDGSFTGSMIGKMGPLVVPVTPVSGTFKMNNDCTAEGILNIPGVGTNKARGVFFNGGKEAYWLPLAGTVPQPYAYCDIEQFANR